MRLLLLVFVVLGPIRILHQVVPALGLSQPVGEIDITIVTTNGHHHACSACAEIGIVMPEGHDETDAITTADTTPLEPSLAMVTPSNQPLLGQLTCNHRAKMPKVVSMHVGPWLQAGAATHLLVICDLF